MNFAAFMCGSAVVFLSQVVEVYTPILAPDARWPSHRGLLDTPHTMPIRRSPLTRGSGGRVKGAQRRPQGAHP